MVCYQLTEEIIEHYMKNLMKVVEINTSLFPTFDDDDLITILHNVQNLYAAEPIMLQFDLPKNGLVVVGDLHGDLYCLLNIVLKNGFPPNTNYLFLGDYVDRGLYQVQLVLFIFLMKLRWPNYITTLKGNHEDYQCGKENEFYDECLRIFKRGRRWYTLINHVFDHMPVCAIISMDDMSKQYKEYSKTDIYKRYVFCRRWFDLSRRNCGYSFNRCGLVQVLRSIKVKTLIRGHEYYQGGIARNFGDDMCYTVHSTTDQNALYEPYSGILKLEKVANTFAVIESSELIRRNANAEQLARKAQMEMQYSFFYTVISYDLIACRYCEQPYPLYVTRRKRCFVYADIMDYMIKNGKFMLFADKLCGKLYWRGTFWRSTSAYDMIFGRPTDDDFPRTFRVCILEEEYKLMEKIYKENGINIESLMPKFRTIFDAHMELQMPVSRFQKLKKRIKLAMGLEPYRPELEYMTSKSAALSWPLSATISTVDDRNVDKTEERTLNIATIGDNQPDEAKEEPDVYARPMPFDSTLCYQRKCELPLEEIQSNSKLFDIHDFSKGNKRDDI
ncbi:Serine/threonine-protein phosphatase [Dirofilaria immitis]|nr:Serine/threonine-protein phosphatase [Dirofilaria immitis]